MKSDIAYIQNKFIIFYLKNIIHVPVLQDKLEFNNNDNSFILEIHKKF